METVKTGKPRGILNQEMSRKKFQLTLHPPSPDLSFFVEHHWIVTWDLRGQVPYLSENLPHPSVHLVFEKDRTRIYGVVTGKFTYHLEGKGQVLGIKFRPGAFYPFVQTPISHFTDSWLSLEQALGIDSRVLETDILSQTEQTEMVRVAETFLRRYLPARDELVETINQVIDCIINNRGITRVDEVAGRLHLNKRTLQRLFHRYVGVSPKWVINRYRLQDAVEQLAGGAGVDWAALASELGYFDQAHFIKAFKAIVGMPPAEYARRAGSGL